jgi:hypothetical protein
MTLPTLYPTRNAKIQFHTGWMMPVTITIKVKVGSTPIEIDLNECQL